MKNDKLISDSGVVQRRNLADMIVIGVCILVCLGLGYLGVMAYLVR